MEPAKESWKERFQYVVAFCLILAFYGMTRPMNHAESQDSLNYALFAQNFPLGTAPDSRNILFHAVNRILVVTSQSLGFEAGALELIQWFSIICGAMSLVVFARLMKRRFEVSTFAAWTGAAFLGLTYGFWRYSGAAEVYVPSIFLILCCLTLLFRYLDTTSGRAMTLISASVLSGVAVLYYQPNVIPLFFIALILFCRSRKNIFAYVSHGVIGALVVIAGIVWSVTAVNGAFPSVGDVTEYLTSRNGEFAGRPTIAVALTKGVLAFGHDMFSAHWTRTIDPVRETLDPLIPGCVYNFNVVAYAGKGIQYLTAIAAVLFLPIVLLFFWLNWIASSEWKIARPRNATLFLIGWLGFMVFIVGTIDPGSFEAWIPALVPFAGLLTVWVIEPCVRMGKHRALVVFVLMMFSYNLFGGMIIWRNSDGDYFRYKSEWVRNELTAEDTVLLNEFDYRLIDYLNYNCKARVVHLHGADRITIFRSHPDIHSIPIDEFVEEFRDGQKRLFVMDDLLSPSPEIKSCRYGEDKFLAATDLANRLKEHTVLVDSREFCDTYQIKIAK